MKNTKIFPKDWLQLHPYKQSGPTDLYYTRIANQIHEMMEQTDLANSFEKEDVIQISMRMAAYFEDVISGLNIWRAFITEYKKQTGNYLPFYTVSDHYYDDEANYEDVRFLLWHYTQQYHGAKKGTFVNPSQRRDGPPHLPTVLQGMDYRSRKHKDAGSFRPGNFLRGPRETGRTAPLVPLQLLPADRL